MRRKETVDELIAKLKETRGSFYDYSKVTVDPSTVKLTIICPIHGEFQQNKYVHLRGSNCPDCAVDVWRGKMTSSTDEFISKARGVHGDKFDYSQSVYSGHREPIKVICPNHGVFNTTPDAHLNNNKKYGCPYCGQDGRKVSQEEFLARAAEKHDHFYDYSKTIYVHSFSPIVIICPIHGEFIQRASKHLVGIGCPKCGKERHRVALNKGTENFINMARNVHGDKYDYSESIYIDAHSHVKIICKTHGAFYQSPGNHYRGDGGCRKCLLEKLSFTKEQFIERSRAVHGNKYSYEHVKYINQITPVVITCLDHGDFKQIPSTHFDGSGCPECSTHGYSVLSPTWIYILRSDCGTYLKIGISNNPRNRIKSLTSPAMAKLVGFNSYRYSCVGYCTGEIPKKLESDFKAHFIHANAGLVGVYGGSGEWFIYESAMDTWIKNHIRDSQ